MTNKRHKYKAKDYRKKVKKYWKPVEMFEDLFFNNIQRLERDMAKETGIKDIEFFFCDGSIVGIGNVSKTLELIHRRYK